MSGAKRTSLAAERVKCLDLFKPTSPLVAGGLITLDFGYRAAAKSTEATWDARLTLSQSLIMSGDSSSRNTERGPDRL